MFLRYRLSLRYHLLRLSHLNLTFLCYHLNLKFLLNPKSHLFL